MRLVFSHLHHCSLTHSLLIQCQYSIQHFFINFLFLQQKNSSPSSAHINTHRSGGTCPVVQTSVIQSTKAYTNGVNPPPAGSINSTDADHQVDADADCVLITDEVLLDENVNNEEDVVVVVDKSNKTSRAQELKQMKNQRLMNIITMSELSSDVEMENNGHITNGMLVFFSLIQINMKLFKFYISIQQQVTITKMQAIQSMTRKWVNRACYY